MNSRVRRRKARAYTLKRSPRAHGVSGMEFRRLVRTIPREILDPLTRGIASAAISNVLMCEFAPLIPYDCRSGPPPGDGIDITPAVEDFLQSMGLWTKREERGAP